MPLASFSRLREGRNRVRHIRRLVAENEQTLGLKLGDHPLEAQRGADVWKRQDAALLRGLDGICTHTLEVEARDLSMAREDRLQSRGGGRAARGPTAARALRTGPGGCRFAVLSPDSKGFLYPAAGCGVESGGRGDTPS